MNLHSFVSYMSCAGSFAAMLGGLYPAALAMSAAGSARLASVQCFLLSRRPVPVAPDGIVPVDAIPVAVVAVVSVAVVTVVS